MIQRLEHRLFGFRDLRHTYVKVPWTSYPEELKISAVKAVVDNAKSLNEVIETFSISSHSVLRQWISKYTSREDIKSTSKS
ncbi:transposase [Enterococcus sp. BWT-B8]|uniref:transposase n=1 Tax=Enterococcus sp. BWT-B8 TaxID=2885157 RepID=UPI003B6409B6